MIIEDRLFYITNQDNTHWKVVATDYKEAIAILEKWRPNTRVRGFTSDPDVVLTKYNVNVRQS